MNDLAIDSTWIHAVENGQADDPFAWLGPHPADDGFVVRTFQPHADHVQIIDRATNHLLSDMTRIDDAGMFVAILPTLTPYRLRVHYGDVINEFEDPYSFPPLLGPLDIHLLQEGRHYQLATCLGAHMADIDGVRGVRFAVWAPNADRVSVVGNFNQWDGRRHPMRKRHDAGVWELFIPRLLPGTLYKYELLGPWRTPLPLKADPVAWACESAPATASIVADDTPPHWTDENWMSTRASRQSIDAPMSIYEVHAVSWIHAASEGRDGWDELADRLVPYVKRMGFTHLELLPIMEHPFGGSWGYQPLGQFAPTATLGPPEAFARFVDRCHAAGIAVLLDWVPAHFPSDAHGLARFDGTALYEHADPREGFHRDWNTYIYNLGRVEVRSFLISSAMHWLQHYHVDGLRVDAVASMLYRDYSRPAGEWIPNKYGGRENLEAVSFLQQLSEAIHEYCPGAILVAEESTAWPGVTRPAQEGGLGFDYKWNMGWMHDSLHYMQEDPVNRSWHHDDLTFGLVYAFSERFILPLSHDEVVHGKYSLIGRMPGDEWQKFANLRAYFGFMWTHPGKKLVFMGGEFAQWREWNHDAGLEWSLLDRPEHTGIQLLVRDLNHLYQSLPALHRHDCDPQGFAWVIIDDRGQSVFAYLRLGNPEEAPALVVCNFTPMPRRDYRVGVPVQGAWQEVFNSDASLYGGSNLGNGGMAIATDHPSHGQPASLLLTLPPLATIILRPVT